MSTPMSTSQEYKKVKMNSLKNPAGLSQQSRVKTNNHETQIKHEKDISPK